MGTCGKWGQGHVDFRSPHWKPHPGCSIPLQIPPPRHLSPLQIPSKCMGTPPRCLGHLWIPPGCPGPLQNTPWTPGCPSVLHSPEAWVPYGAPPLDPWVPYRSMPCPDTWIAYISSLPHWMLRLLTVPSCRHSGPLRIPHPHLCVCLSFPYGLGVSAIPPTPLCLFYTGPSWAQWAGIQEEGQGKEQGPAVEGGGGGREPGIQEALLPLCGPPRSLGSH